MEKSIVTLRLWTLSGEDIKLSNIVMEDEVSFDKLCGEPNQRNCVLARFSFSTPDDWKHNP